MSHLNLADIQGIILRRYLMPVERNILLKVTNPAAARSVLGRMVSRNEADALQVPQPKSPPSALDITCTSVLRGRD